MASLRPRLGVPAARLQGGWFSRTPRRRGHTGGVRTFQLISPSSAFSIDDTGTTRLKSPQAPRPCAVPRKFRPRPLQEVARPASRAERPAPPQTSLCTENSSPCAQQMCEVSSQGRSETQRNSGPLWVLPNATMRLDAGRSHGPATTSVLG